MASLDRNHDANHSEHHLPGLLREDAMASMTLLVALLVSLATLHAVDAAQGRKAPLLPPPPQCTTSNPPKVPMRATIVDGDNAVQSDGLGEYVDNVSNANVETINAFALRTFKQWWPNSKPIRAILVDLNNPVPDGVGVPRGIFIDQRAVFAAFWYVDSNSHVHALQDIPIGITVESDRTQIWITSPVNSTSADHADGSERLYVLCPAGERRDLVGRERQQPADANLPRPVLRELPGRRVAEIERTPDEGERAQQPRPAISVDRRTP
jgi:hypothetical protein